jgi:hypothetical protein
MEEIYKMKKRNLIFGILLFLFIAINFSLMQNVFAQGSTVCAVHSSEGICQDVDLSGVSPGSETYTTSCTQGPGECAIGTCVDTNLGTCLASSRAACDPTIGGEFYDTSPTNTPACNDGCCIVGTGGSVTTRAHCEKLGLDFPGASNFIEGITNDLECTVTAAPTLEGACVYDTATGKTCSFETQEDCSTRIETNPGTAFHPNWLCTNENLQNEGVNCQETHFTTCVSGKDPVYFKDSCGNPANIYDATIWNTDRERNYWNYVAGTNDVSLPEIATPGSTTNGYCDYPRSTCAQYDRSIDIGGAPQSPGDYICRDLSCKAGPFVQEFYDKYNRNPVNGETWCARTDINNPAKITFGNNSGLTDETGGSATLVSSLGKNQSLPGSRDFRLGCNNGRVTIEMCADYRNKVCGQNQNSNGVFQSGCVLNNWATCYIQSTSQDCLNPDIGGDCQWIIGISNLRDDEGNRPVYDVEADKLIPREGDDDKRLGASCVPKYPPGFSVSADASDTAKAAAIGTCSIPNTNCIVQFERGALESLFGTEDFGWRVSGPLINRKLNITCLDDNGTIMPGWEKNFTNLCFAMGDCGISANYINTRGYNSLTDLFEVMGNLSETNETPPAYHL